MKKFLTLIAICFVMLAVCGCDGDKPGILFNRYPITEDTVMNYEQVFERGKRIYYLVVMPEKIHSRYMYLQIIKKDNDYGRLGYKIYYGKNIRLKNENIYYYDDYIVINEPGAYVMQIFSRDNPQKVLTMGEFWVR